MKKKIIIIFLLIILCGCGKKKIKCVFNDDDKENMKSYRSVLLISEKGTIKTEELYAVYKFKDSSTAEKYYNSVEKIFEQDDSITVEQKDENIIAKGKKDVTKMQYDEKSKINYYEQLGYTCK